MIYAIVGGLVVLLIVGYLLARGTLGKQGEHEQAPPATRPPLAHSYRPTGPLSASDVLALVQELQRRDAAWAEIFSSLNPTTESETAALLLKLKGKYTFEEKGLIEIAAGCRRAMQASPMADGLEALRCAIQGRDPKPAPPTVESVPPLFDGQNALIDDLHLVFRDEKRYSDLQRVARADSARRDLATRNIDPNQFLDRFRERTGDNRITEMLAEQWKA
jgi:hypothetical protein